MVEEQDTVPPNELLISYTFDHNKVKVSNVIGGKGLIQNLSPLDLQIMLLGIGAKRLDLSFWFI